MGGSVSVRSYAKLCLDNSWNQQKMKNDRHNLPEVFAIRFSLRKLEFCVKSVYKNLKQYIGMADEPLFSR